MSTGNFKFVALLTIITLLNQNNCLLKLEENPIENCKTYTNDFWDVYKNYFNLTNSITISVLYNRDHYFLIQEFTDAIINIMDVFNNMGVTVTVRKKFFRTIDLPKKPSNFVGNFNNSSLKNSKFHKINRERKLSSDPSKGNFIIVWDVDALDYFLEKDAQFIFCHPRAIYAVFFVYNRPGICLDWKTEVKDVLVKFWKQYYALQVIIQVPCSCVSNSIFVYHPFIKTENNSWGYVKEHTISEIVRNPNLLLNTLEDLEEYPIEVSMFERNPTAVTTFPRFLRRNIIYDDLSKSKGFGGVDGCVLAVLAQLMNFEVVIKSPSDGNNFGDGLPNHTTTGSLRDVVEKKVQLSANNRFILDYNTQEIEFTNIIMGDDICVVVPKAQRIPQWMIIFKCFTCDSWLLMLTIWCCLAIMWYFYRPLEFRNRELIAFLEVFSIFLGHPANLKPKKVQHIFLTVLLIFNIIISGIFQGSLVTSFSRISYYKDMNTLEELDKSQLKIATSLNIFDMDNRSDIMRKLNKKRIYVRGNSLRLAAYKRSVAGIERKRDAKLIIQTRFMQDDTPLLHIMDECPVSYLVAYIVPKGSPYLPMFNFFIQKLIEGGFIQKWYDDVTNSMIMDQMFSVTKHTQIQKAFDLRDMQTAFYILFVGCILSVAVFVCELNYSEKYFY